MIKSKRSGNILDTDMPIIAVSVTTTGEDIPKILREYKECLSEYKAILKKSSTAKNLEGRCIPVFNRDEKCFALLFDKNCDASAKRKSVEQLEYYSNVTNCCVAFRECDFDPNIMEEVLSCEAEEWV